MLESKIYFYIKKYLRLTGWNLLGGEPPDGSNDLRRIEIRDSKHLVKGSKGALKIDLIASKGRLLLLIEIKPEFDHSDVDKLNYILDERQRDLFEALLERCHLQKENFDYVIKCLGLNKFKKEQLPHDYTFIHLKDSLKVDILFGRAINSEISNYFDKKFTF